MRDLIHMTQSQREAYAEWLKRIVRGLKGSVAERLRAAAQAILNSEGDMT